MRARFIRNEVQKAQYVAFSSSAPQLNGTQKQVGLGFIGQATVYGICVSDIDHRFADIYFYSTLWTRNYSYPRPPRPNTKINAKLRSWPE